MLYFSARHSKSKPLKAQLNSVLAWVVSSKIKAGLVLNRTSRPIPFLIHMQLVFRQQGWEFEKGQLTAINSTLKKPQRIDPEEHALLMLPN